MQNFLLTWTLSPFLSRTGGPAAIKLPFRSEATENDTVYLAEPIGAQFEPNGVGLGTFSEDGSLSLDTNSRLDIASTELAKPIEAGQVLRYAFMYNSIH
jgi:hypothetical protein